MSSNSHICHLLGEVRLKQNNNSLFVLQSCNETIKIWPWKTRKKLIKYMMLSKYNFPRLSLPVALRGGSGGSIFRNVDIQ